MSTFRLQPLRLAARCVLVVVILCFVSGPAQAQLTVNVIHASINSLTIADVDFLNTTTPKWLFTVSIGTGGGQVQVQMTMSLSVYLASGEQFNNPVVRVVTQPFLAPVTLTNIDLTTKQVVKIQSDYFDETAKQRFKDLSLPTGALPAGTYHFDVSVVAVNQGGSGGGQFDIVLSNPSSIELVFPVDGDPSVSPLPLFQWRYDGMASRISIFEKRPQQSSLEEAASGVPQLTADVGTTSFQYPSSGARALEPGKSYVWFVDGLSGATGGTVLPIRSELRSFTVSAAGAASLMSYLDDLERALDAKYKPIFDEIRAEALLPTGVIRLNGSPISTVELLDIIRQLRFNPDAVQGVNLDQ